jgi:hypothetical protein
MQPNWPSDRGAPALDASEPVDGVLDGSAS